MSFSRRRESRGLLQLYRIITFAGMTIKTGSEIFILLLSCFMIFTKFYDIYQANLSDRNIRVNYESGEESPLTFPHLVFSESLREGEALLV